MKRGDKKPFDFVLTSCFDLYAGDQLFPIVRAIRREWAKTREIGNEHIFSVRIFITEWNSHVKKFRVAAFNIIDRGVAQLRNTYIGNLAG
jgi:hypothetical protein